MTDGSDGPVRRALDALYLGAGYLAGVFLVAIFVLMMALAVGREVNINVPSGDDFTSWCMAAMAFLGLAHTFKRGDMIRVGLLIERLTGRPRRWLELWSLAIGGAYTLYFAWHAIRLTYDSWRFNDMAQGVVAVPLWIPQIGFSLGLSILAVAVIDEFVNVAKGNRPSYEREPPRSPEEMVERIASGESL
jgi:TRAP-type C4-dicarboxylate transport system permease small subunit